ncbi:hypothetical protein [Hymenobacter cellulosilyticus]|uniref:Uncharacterized protein n=1 Tax=Hymenobacter cellulosilyticus TaxID=2932248 RepID=A0A8T9Q688_9BACT|nr:hypothetical protein [Hymenobacter cellulosilyticus]UOQ70969.1 hypothetical protein MUN79_20160 [Hymenobacter cellulosilyticus]
MAASTPSPTLVKTSAQIQTELTLLRLDLGNTLKPGVNVSGPTLAALLQRQSDLTFDLTRLQASSASKLHYGAVAPPNTLGKDTDLYRNTVTWDEY